MDFELTSENRMILNAVKDWVAKECPEEQVREWDASGGPPDSIWKKFLRLGFTALCIPETYGGEGPDYLGAVLVTEVLASRYPALARLYGAMTFYGGGIFSEFGGEEQKNEMLPKFINGQQTAGVWIAGLDSTEAAPVNGVPQATGENPVYISGGGRFVGPVSPDGILLFPASDASANTDEMNPYFVVADRSGLELKADDTMGYKGNAGVRVFFRDMAMGPADRLDNAGADVWARILALVRLELSAEAIGIARGSLEYAAKYARQRMQFGRPIIRFPAIRDMLVQNDCHIEAAALQLYRAAAGADKGKAYAADAFRAYYASCRAARRAAMDGLQILGGYGYTMEFAAQQYVRDVISLFNTGAESEELKDRIAEKFG
jgi:alkylation response protein AidB-like acyl-CoA dehydrogenase